MPTAAETMHPTVKVSAEIVRQCEARAHRIVETFLDPIYDRAEFLDQLRWINPDHYRCITEERAIQKTCGYPLCDKTLFNIPTKKYQICTNKNKVYDLTHRKNFCSNQCYKASNYLMQQLSTSPLWVREQEEKPKFILLENSTELIGEEICFGIERVSLSRSELVLDSEKTDESKMSESKANYNHSVADVSTKCSVTENNTDPNLRVAFDDTVCHNVETTSLENSSDKERHSIGRSNSIADECVNQLTLANSKVCLGNNLGSQYNEMQLTRQLMPVNVMQNGNNPPLAGSDNAENATQNQPKKLYDNSQNYKSETEFVFSSVNDKGTSGTSSFVLRVEKSLREWCTVDTLTFILGVENVKRMMLEKGLILETREPAKCDSVLYERYATIFKKLKILKMEEEKYANEELFEKPSRPLPDFATLEKQTREMEIKVRAFYRGDKKVTFDENKNENDDDGTSVVLPPLHQQTKMAIRRNVVLDKLKRILPDLAMMLGFRTVDLNEEIKQLALTCKFAAHNITFKPVEWNLIGLIFIKLLSLRDAKLQKHFHEKANYVNAMLMSYKLENNYLDLLCTWLMDIDQISKNNAEPE